MGFFYLFFLPLNCLDYCKKKKKKIGVMFFPLFNDFEPLNINLTQIRYSYKHSCPDLFHSSNQEPSHFCPVFAMH